MRLNLPRRYLRPRRRRRPGRLALLALAATIGSTAALLAMPVLVLRLGDGRSVADACRAGSEAPTMLGLPTVTADAFTAWWATVDTGVASPLAVEPATLFDRYLDEGRAEGVRGDHAFAQAALETGYFTSAGVAAHNYAGIGHYDGRTGGMTFADTATGVRAHVQLLKKYAAGNDAPLARPDVSPDAGGRATTWPELAGTWATDPDYWRSITRIHTAMTGSPSDACALESPASPRAVPSSSGDVPLATVGRITVHQSLAAQLEALLAAARHDGLPLTGWGYRSHDRQIELRREHCGTSQYAIYEMPSSRCSPPTARPGSSMHEQGLAIDFEDCASRSSPCHRWLAANAATYGLHNLPSEPWHWSTTGT